MKIKRLKYYVLPMLFIAALLANTNLLASKASAATTLTTRPNGRIALTTTAGPGGYDIYSVDSNGNNPLQLTAGSVNTMYNQTPAYSPDGKKIAYSSRESGAHNIWVMNADGSNQTRLTTGAGYDYYPSWSPDGSKIAFSGQKYYSGPDASRFTIQVMNPDGTGLTAISDNSAGLDDFGPSWSPDGTKIAFMRIAQGGGGVSQAYVYDIGSSTFTQITNFSSGISGGRSTSWSPDGNKIAIDSNGGDQYTYYDSFLGMQVTARHNWIYTMNSDGSNLQAVNYCPTSNSNSPSFSPDGKKLLFITECGQVSGNTHAVVTDVDGSNPQFVGITGEIEEKIMGWQALPLTSSVEENDGTVTNTIDTDEQEFDYEAGDPSGTQTNKVVFVVNGKVGQVNVNSNGVLKGNGTIVMGVTVKPGGKLAPGNSPGCITSGAGLTFNSGSTYEVEIAGTTACTEYDQTVVTGAVDLGSATLNTLLLNNFVGKQNDTFKIIDNDGSDTVTGTFNGLAEGATFTVGGTQFRISYVGGDGNDVVLTIVNSPTPNVPNTGLQLLTSNPLVTLAVTLGAVAVLARLARRVS